MALVLMIGTTDPRVTAGVMPPVLHLDRPLLQHLQNQYSSAAYVDSKGREFGRTYSSDPNQKPTQVDKITDVAGYGAGRMVTTT
jgi:hypothetical protein